MNYLWTIAVTLFVLYITFKLNYNWIVWVMSWFSS